MSKVNGAQAGTLVVRLAAEFAVIVLGVLVALWVDSWSTAREEAERELELLGSLATELRESIDSLSWDQEFTRGRESTLEWLLHFPVDTESIPSDSLASIALAANWTDSFYPTLRTYESMIATGTFDLIRNSEVRLALDYVKAKSEEYQDYRAQATQQWNDVYSVIWIRETGVHPIPGGELSPEPAPGVFPASRLTAAMRDDFFRGVIDRRRIFLYYVTSNGDALSSAMSTALEMVEEEPRVRR